MNIPDEGFFTLLTQGMRNRTVETLQRALYHTLRDAILQGTLTARCRLPGSRVMAERLHLSRNTVNAALEQLATRLGMAPPPAGSRAEWVFPADVRGMPDQPVLPRGEMGGLSGRTAEEVLQQAQDFARQVGLDAGGRLATDLAPDSVEGVLAAIAAPLAVDASVLYGDAPQESPTARAGG